MQPHIEALLDMCSLTMEHYQFWLTELARHHAMIQNHSAMSDTLAAWCGEAYAIPTAILERQNEEGLQASLAFIKWLGEGVLHKERLAEMQGYIRDCLQDTTLSPYERATLVRCAATLQDFDPDNPTFPALVYGTPQNDEKRVD